MLKKIRENCKKMRENREKLVKNREKFVKKIVKNWKNSGKLGKFRKHRESSCKIGINRHKL